MTRRITKIIEGMHEERRRVLAHLVRARDVVQARCVDPRTRTRDAIGARDVLDELLHDIQGGNHYNEDEAGVARRLSDHGLSFCASNEAWPPGECIYGTQQCVVHGSLRSR